MDTFEQVTTVIADNSESLGSVPRQGRSIAEKRRIVEETLVVGASVARVARAYGINANQVFCWRRLYVAGRLGERKPAMKLLPVRVSESLPAPVPVERGSADFPEPPAGHDSHRTAPSAGADRMQSRSGVGARVAGVPTGMVGPPTNTRVWIAAVVTDLRRGFTGLSAVE